MYINDVNTYEYVWMSIDEYNRDDIGKDMNYIYKGCEYIYRDIIVVSILNVLRVCFIFFKKGI